MTISSLVLAALLVGAPCLAEDLSKIQMTPEMEALAKEAQCAILQAQGQKVPAGCGAAPTEAKLPQGLAVPGATGKQSAGRGGSARDLTQDAVPRGMGSDDPKTWSLDTVNK